MLESYNDKYLQEDLEIIANSDIPLDTIANSTILITGATGLLGMQLVRALACCNRIKKANIKILALVRNVEKARNIYGNLLDRTEIVLVKADITNKFKIDDGVDFIFHCASITASKTMVSQPVETIMTAVEGTKNLLELARAKKAKSFVYVSSMEMYGTFENITHPVKECDLGYINPLNVRSNYPESKRLCENMCIAYLSEYGVPVKIARLAQSFGAGVLPWENRIFAQFARCVIKNENIILHTSGKSEGNYCYLRDAIRALIILLIKGENGEAYNISNEDTHIRIVDMAKMVSEKIAKGNIEVLFEIPKTNVFGYAADTKLLLDSSKMRNLGWKPEVGLEEAYIRLIHSLEENMVR